MFTVDLIVEKLNLKPLPKEGGFFAQTYRSENTIPASALKGRFNGERSLATAIYYLLTRDSYSALHRLPGDEVFHFYLGDPVEMLRLRSDGTAEVVVLGSDILRGMRPQVIVPGGVWQGSRLKPGGEFGLMGTTMSPGFEFSDCVWPEGKELVAQYPQVAELIRVLLPDN